MVGDGGGAAGPDDEVEPAVEVDVGAFEAKIPMGRTGTPDDLAAPTLTLLSDDHSPYVTGAILPVDGGLAHYNWIDRPEVLE